MCFRNEKKSRLNHKSGPYVIHVFMLMLFFFLFPWIPLFSTVPSKCWKSAFQFWFTLHSHNFSSSQSTFFFSSPVMDSLKCTNWMETFFVVPSQFFWKDAFIMLCAVCWMSNLLHIFSFQCTYIDVDRLLPIFHRAFPLQKLQVFIMQRWSIFRSESGL